VTPDTTREAREARLADLAAIYAARAIGWDKKGKPHLATQDRQKADDIRKAIREPVISSDGEGPHRIGVQRRWLAHQLLDCRLSEQEAFSIVKYHPGVSGCDAAEKLQRAECEKVDAEKEHAHNTSNQR
jgi:hypothetical protein